MSIYKINDINKEVSKLVSELIGKGYVLNMSNMNVCYSNRKGTIELYNESKKEYVTVYLEEHYYSYDKHRSIDIVMKVSDKEDDGWGKDRGTEVLHKKFYSVTHGQYSWYRNYKETECFTTDIDFVEEVVEKRKNRSRMRAEFMDGFYKELNNYNPEIIIKLVNKHKGYKSCRKSQITRVEALVKNGGIKHYLVSIEGKPYKVTIDK